MKNTFLFSLVFIYNFSFTIFNSASAQAPPPGINYQAVARDVSGNPLVSTAVSVDFIIHSTAIAGPTVYSENQNTTTNLFGLFNLVIGSVDPVNFSAIQWNTDKFYLEVIVNGNPMGTTQFLSVPYAFHSKTADSLIFPPAGAFIWKRKPTGEVFLNTLSDSVGIGTAFPSAKLHINNNSDNTALLIRANTVQSNTNPLIKLQKANGADLMWIHSDDLSNVLIGVGSGAGGTGNIFIGNNAGTANSTGTFNTFLGFFSGSENTTGTDNTFLGNVSGGNNIAGSGNVFVGSHSGENSNANDNTFVGGLSGQSNTTGAFNTFLGASLAVLIQQGRETHFLEMFPEYKTQGTIIHLSGTKQAH